MRSSRTTSIILLVLYYGTYFCFKFGSLDAQCQAWPTGSIWQSLAVNVGPTTGIGIEKVLVPVHYQGRSGTRQLLVCNRIYKPLRGLHHGGSGPPQRHVGIAPAFHVPRDPSHRAHDVLDDRGAYKRSGDFRRQADTDGREEVIDPFEDTAADTSRDLFEPPREIAQHFSGLVGIVEFQCLLSDSFNSVLPQIV